MCGLVGFRLLIFLKVIVFGISEVVVPVDSLVDEGCFSVVFSFEKFGSNLLQMLHFCKLFSHTHLVEVLIFVFVNQGNCYGY